MYTGTVTLEFEGKSYSASYSVDDSPEPGVITLDSAYGTRVTQIGGSRAETLARMLFREVLRAARARGELTP